MYDVVVVGGGVAGLSAALMLGRARRKVLVLDAGTPRNTPAQHAHGYLSRDGIPPLELLRIAREELAAYANVEVRAGEVASAAAGVNGFSLTATDGPAIETRKLILATGVIDVLPAIPGLAEVWGNGVYHCPYCHGWEVSDKRWAVLGEGPPYFERAALFRGWASELVVLTNGTSSLSAVEKARLESLAGVDERRVTSVARTENDDVTVSFEDGASLTFGGVFIATPQVQRSSLAETLGCELEDFTPTSSRYVKIDPASGETTVKGVYAAGDMIGPQQNLVFSSAAGARAAIRLNATLAMEDAEAVVSGPTAAAA